MSKAVVREVFRSSKAGNIYGVVVIEGTIKATDKFKRRPIESLRRFKDYVDSVDTGKECGIGLGDYADAQVGDVLEFKEAGPYDDLNLTDAIRAIVREEIAADRERRDE